MRAVGLFILVCRWDLRYEESGLWGSEERNELEQRTFKPDISRGIELPLCILVPGVMLFWAPLSHSALSLVGTLLL